MENIKISLKAARVNSGFTQKEVARALRVSPVTVIGWEKGKVRPAYASVKCLADMYGIPIDNIFLPAGLAESKAR